MIYIELFWIMAAGLLFEYMTDEYFSRDQKRKLYIVTTIALLWLLAALRSTEWVASLHLDAGGYAYTFRLDRSQSWRTLFGRFVERYFYGYGDLDAGYDLLNKLIGYVTSDYNVFSLISDSIFFIPMGMLLYRHSQRIRELMFAFVFYTAMIQTHMFSGARQMFAVGVGIVAIMSAMENKKRRAIVYLLMAVTIHFSALLLVIPIVLIFLNLKPGPLKLIHVASLATAPLVFLFPNQVIRFMAGLIGSEKYSIYGSSKVQGGANTFIFLLMLLSLFCYIAIRDCDLTENEDIRKLYIMVPLFTFFGPLINSNGSMIRICLYFYVYLMVLFPFGMEHIFTEESQDLAYAIVMVALLYFELRGGVMDYHFMWQGL